MSSVVSQLNAAFGTNLQFSNPSGTVLQVLNNGAGNVVNSLSATSTVTSLAERQRAAAAVYRGRPTDHGRDHRRAARRPRGSPAAIEVNAALVASPSSLVAYAVEYRGRRPDAAEFPARPDDQCASLTYSPATGLGSAAAPYSGTLSQYMSAVVSQQAQAANAATNLQQGQETVVTRPAAAVQRPIRRQYRYRNVEPDCAAERLQRQCPSDVDSPADDDDAIAGGVVMSITGPGSITAANVLAQNNMKNQLNTLGEELASGQAAQTYSGLRIASRRSAGAQRAAFGHQRL